MNVYLIHLYYDDGQTYESMGFDSVITAFDTKDKAEQFCKNNSDNQSGINCYEILKPRKQLMVEDDCVYDFDEVFDDFDESNYWMSIEEMKMY